MKVIFPNLKRHNFLLGIFAICLSYFGFQLFNTYFTAIGVDDFWFTHWAFRYKDGIPYVDFLPYKTVLGYYFLLIPILISDHFAHMFLDPLFFTKNTIAFANTLILLASGLWLRQFFSKPAILISLLLVFSSQYFLSYSTNIRVDLFAYWFCLFSVLCLLEKRFILSAVLIGIGFFISQKVIWYIFATDVALALCWLFFERDRKQFFKIVLYNLTIIGTILIYIAFWSAISNLKTVLHSMFYEAYIMHQLDWYSHARKAFWTFTITWNPVPFLLWPVTFFSLFVTFKNDHGYKLRFFCVIYASAIMLCLIPYKQVFPYYMLTTIPAFLLLYTSFFSWLFGLFKTKESIQILYIEKSGIWSLLSLYLFYFIYSFIVFRFMEVYFVIAVFPVLLTMYITNTPNFLSHKINNLYLIFAVLFFSLYISFSLFLIKLPLENGRYQKANLTLANTLLQDNTDYVAGIELFYNRNQPIPGMKHLGGAAIDYLYSPTPKLRTGMLSSLYYTPDITSDEVVKLLEKSSVKFYVNNYRMNALPPTIKHYLQTEYQHFWGSIYLYAPKIGKGSQTKKIRFAGHYQLESNEPVFINKQQIFPNTVVILNAGNATFSSKQPFRLKLIPDNIHNNKWDFDFKKDEWEKLLT